MTAASSLHALLLSDSRGGSRGCLAPRPSASASSVPPWAPPCTSSGRLCHPANGTGKCLGHLSPPLTQQTWEPLGAQKRVVHPGPRGGHPRGEGQEPWFGGCGFQPSGGSHMAPCRLARPRRGGWKEPPLQCPRTEKVTSAEKLKWPLIPQHRCDPAHILPVSPCFLLFGGTHTGAVCPAAPRGVIRGSNGPGDRPRPPGQGLSPSRLWLPQEALSVVAGLAQARGAG